MRINQKNQQIVNKTQFLLKELLATNLYLNSKLEIQIELMAIAHKNNICKILEI